MQHSDWRLVDEPESPGDKDIPVDWTHIFDEDWGEASEPDGDKETSAGGPLEMPGDDAVHKSPSDVAQVAEDNTPTPQVLTEPIHSPEPAEAENLFAHPGAAKQIKLPRQALGQGFPHLPSHFPTATPRLHPVPSPGLSIPSPLVTSSGQQSYFMPITDAVQPHATTVSTSLSREIQGSEAETSEHLDTVAETESGTALVLEATSADNLVTEAARTSVDHAMQDWESPVISAEPTMETPDFSKVGHPDEPKAEEVDGYDPDFSSGEVRAIETRENFETTGRLTAGEHKNDNLKEGNTDDEVLGEDDTYAVDVAKDVLEGDYAEKNSMEDYDAEEEVEEDDWHEKQDGRAVAPEETCVADNDDGPGKPTYAPNGHEEDLTKSNDIEERPSDYDSEAEDEQDEEDEDDEIDEIENLDEDEESDEEEEHLYGDRYEEDDDSEAESDMEDDGSPTQHQSAAKVSQPEVIVLDSDSEDEIPPQSRIGSVAQRIEENGQELGLSASPESEHSSNEGSVDSDNEDWPEDEGHMEASDSNYGQTKDERLEEQPSEHIPVNLSGNESSRALPLEEEHPEEEVSDDEKLTDNATRPEVASHNTQDDRQLGSEQAEDEMEDEELQDKEDMDDEPVESESESEEEEEESEEEEEDEVVLLDQTYYGKSNRQWVENQHLDDEPTRPEHIHVDEQIPERVENQEPTIVSTLGAEYMEYPDLNGDMVPGESHGEQHDATESAQILEEDYLHHDFTPTQTIEEAHAGGKSHNLELAIDPELFNSSVGQEQAMGNSFQGNKQDNGIPEIGEETSQVPKPNQEIDYSMMLDGAASPRIFTDAVSERKGSTYQSQPVLTPSSTALNELHSQSVPVPVAAEFPMTPEPTQERTSQNNDKPSFIPAALLKSQPLDEDIAEENFAIDATSVAESREGSQEIEEPLMHDGNHIVQSLEAGFAFDDDAKSALDDISLVDVDRHYPGLRSKLSYFAPLATLVDHYNALVDTISAVTEVRPVIRASSGKKDYILTLQLTDPSMAGTTYSAQILRPFKAALPSVTEGDAILLRNFKVKSFNHSMMLVSVNTSAWAVFNGQTKMQVEGPPVEYGKEEETYATDMRQWYHEDGMAMVADAQLQASIQMAGREETPESSVAVSESESIDSTQRVGERGEPSISNLSSRRNRKSHRRITIHELRDGRRYTEVGSPSGKEIIHELRDGTVYANI